MPDNADDCRAWEEPGAKAVVGRATTIADGGPWGTGLIIPHRCALDRDLPAWKREHNASDRRRPRPHRARLRLDERLGDPRDCRLKVDGIRYAMRGVACLRNLSLPGD